MAANDSPEIRYRRVLLKLSGETLQSEDHALSIDPEIVATLAARIRDVRELGVELAIVIGGGNIFRGAAGQNHGIERVTGDYMGMLATVINALALQDALEKAGVATRVQTASDMRAVAEPFIRRRALHHLEKGRVVIFGGGTGNPYFSTDSAAALRASEIGADALFKGTKVDGIYDRDPVGNPNAQRFQSLSYDEAIEKRLKVMDTAAFTMCRDSGIPIIVFNVFEGRSIERVLRGEPVGTLVSESTDKPDMSPTAVHQSST